MRNQLESEVMFEHLKHMLSGQNQFASGGLLLMVLGSIGVFVRSLPEQLGDWLVRQATMTITVTDDDAAFQWTKEWFLDQQFSRHIRRVDLDTTLRGAELALIPAPGRHLFWYSGRPFWVWFWRSEETKGRSQRRVESLTFRTLGRRQSFLRRFVAEIAACHHEREKMTSQLYVYDDYWTCVRAYSPRLLSSVILKPGEKEHLIQDLARFKSSRARYRQLGVPYHRGYLLYGPPGTGKTSLVSALAGHLGMSIYFLNLTDFNDRTLKAAMNEIPENSLVLFEDIDCMRAGHRRTESNGEIKPHVGQESPGQDETASRFGVTLSGLLNVLDGFHAPENVVFVMTTNHIEALDPALLRPGRIDYKLYLGEASESQRAELFRRFFPSATELEARHFAQAHRAETMAQFQGLLLGLEQQSDPLLCAVESPEMQEV